jgi:hypothetical protein
MTLPPPQPLDSFPAGEDSSPSHFAVRQFTPENITNTFPIIVTITAHGFQNGQALRATKFVTLPLSNSTGMEQLNNRLFFVQQATTNSFVLSDIDTLGVDGRNYTPYISGGQFTLTGPTLPIVNPGPPPPPGNPPFPPE